MSYDNLIKAARRVVYNYRGLASGDLRAFVDDLATALKAADPQELTALRQENEALRAGLAELQRQAEGLREREASLVSELVREREAGAGIETVAV